MAKTLEVEPTEEKTVKEESSGKLVSPLTYWTLPHVYALLTVTCSLVVWYFCVLNYFCAL